MTRWVITLLLASLVLPAAARANASAGIAGNGNPYFHDDPAAADNLMVTGDKSAVTFTDSVAISAASTPAGCTNVTAKSVRCAGSIAYARVAASSTGAGPGDAIDAAGLADIGTDTSGFQTITGSPQDDKNAAPYANPMTAHLGAGNDTFMGGDGNDTIDGGPGDDAINGGAGNDTLSGGDGNDNLNSGAGVDNLDGGAGTDLGTFIQEGQAVDVDMAAPGSGTQTAVGIEHLGGTPFDDTLKGTDANEQIDGGPGNDTIDPRGGSDSVYGGQGDDTLLLRDGVKDTGTCDDIGNPGAGTHDTAVIDDIDAVYPGEGCETIAAPTPPPAAAPSVGGTNATLNPTFTISWATSTKRPALPAKPVKAKSIGYGQTATIVGRVLNNQGAGVNDGRVTLYTSLLTSERTPFTNPKGTEVHTDANGYFSLPIGPSPSLRVEITYFSGIREYGGAEHALHWFGTLAVTGRVSLKAAHRRIRNGAAPGFSGTVAGPQARGQRVELEALLGRRWFTFASATADSKGRWHVGAAFRGRTGQSRYRIRAVVPKDPGYPYRQATSPETTVTIR